MNSRYTNTIVGSTLKKIGNKNKKVTKLNTTLYDKVPARDDDVWVISQVGDRFDLLADEFYGDTQLWWYIARANNMHTMNIPHGTSMRIPASVEYAVGK
jgi:hypothetical protein